MHILVVNRRPPILSTLCQVLRFCYVPGCPEGGIIIVTTLLRNFSIRKYRDSPALFFAVPIRLFYALEVKIFV
jgi:hypothetical protein